MGGKNFKKGGNYKGGKGYGGKTSDGGKSGNSWGMDDGKGAWGAPWQADGGWNADGGWPDKGKGWGQSEEAGTGWQKKYGLRIVSKNLLSKQMLKVVHDESGNAVVGGVEGLAVDSFRMMISPDASELDARAPYGFSMLLSALKGLHTHIEALPSQANAPIRHFFRSPAGERLLEMTQTLQFDRIKATPERHTRYFKEIIQILQQQKHLMSHLPACIAETAGAYLGLVWLYDGLIHFNGLTMWSERTPDVEWLQGPIDTWKESKPTIETTARYLSQSYSSRRIYESAWAVKRPANMKAGPWKDDDVVEDNSWAVLAGKDDTAPNDKKNKKKKDKASSSDQSEESKTKKKKKSKKATKKDKSASAESASQEDAKKKKKKKNKDKKAKASSASESPERKQRIDEKTSEALEARTATQSPEKKKRVDVLELAATPEKSDE